MTQVTSTPLSPNGDATKDPAAPLTEPVTMKLPLSKVFADHAWNARAEGMTGGVGDLGEDHGTAAGITSLAQSMRASKQDTPAVARLIPKGYKNKDMPKSAEVLLCAGFRRYKALEELAAEGHRMAKDPSWDPKHPTILVTVDPTITDEADALAVNIRENSARDDLRAPDFAWQVYQYLSKLPEDDKRRAVAAVAKVFAKHERYVRRLMNITLACFEGRVATGGTETKCRPEPAVFEAWRASPKFLPVKDMELIFRTAGPWKTQYDNAVRSHMSDGEEVLGEGESEGGDGEGVPRAGPTWVDRAVEKAAEHGRVLGRVAEWTEIVAKEDKLRGVKLDVEDVPWEERMLRALFPFKRDAKGRAINRLIAAAKRGVAEGRREARQAYERQVQEQEEAEAAEAGDDE